LEVFSEQFNASAISLWEKDSKTKEISIKNELIKVKREADSNNEVIRKEMMKHV